MANIKTTQQEWDKAREYFEAGLSLTKIVEKTGISKSQISKKSNAEGWEKGFGPLQGRSFIEPPSLVYLVTCDEFSKNNLYKIGYANNIKNRISAMQTGCPYVLYAYRCYEVKNPIAVEFALHSLFDNKRKIGEWFTLDEIDINYLDSANFNLVKEDS
jgi:hypothetical protein